MKNVTFSDFINQIALFSVQGNTAERQDNKDFFFFDKKDVRSVMGALVYLVKTRLPEYIGASPFEIQVLTPMRKGELGVEHLNEVLQYYLNPASESKKEKEGDRNGRWSRSNI